MLNIKTWIRHNQGVSIGIAICILLLVWFCGCETRTQSLIEKNRRVTLPELKTEYNSELRRLEAELLSLEEKTALRQIDIQRQEAFREALFNHAITIASGGTISPIGIATTLGSILGIGAVIDNRRKDVHIKTLKNTS